MYEAWANGLMPSHRPSLGELELFASGYGRPQPVAIVGVPTGR